jgi:competence protein ComK
MCKYEINSSTQAIVPLNDYSSVIYEDNEQFIVSEASNKIIKSNCGYYGSSYNGRCEGTKYLTGIKTKFPIVIDEVRNLIFFPTTSARTQQSTWISLNSIDMIKKKQNNSYIVFKNSRKLDLDISFYSLENQYSRAVILKSKLLDRQKNS